MSKQVAGEIDAMRDRLERELEKREAVVKAARVAFTYPDGFDGVECPVKGCFVTSTDVLDHLIVEDDYAHNCWLGARLEHLRNVLAALASLDRETPHD